MLDKVAEALKHYCDRVETDALGARLKRSPKKREIEHFDGLARYQVKGESFASVRKTHPTNSKAVDKLSTKLLSNWPNIFR